MLSRLILFLALTLIPFIAESKIIETIHISDAIELIDKDTWFLVDLDNCMFEGKQALGHANEFYDELDQRMKKGMTKEEGIRDFYPQWIRSQKICAVQPLEKDFVPSLLALQNQGIVVMGLTHRQTFVAESTLQQVESLGLSFKKTCPSQDSFIVPAANPTLYIDGVLFVSDYNKKSDVFIPFLSIINQYPKKIVFIDDKRKNLEELEKPLSDLGIEYIGVHYRAIEHVPQVYSRELATFQKKFLDTIMSNEAAQLLIDHGINN